MKDRAILAVCVFAIVVTLVWTVRDDLLGLPDCEIVGIELVKPLSVKAIYKGENPTGATSWVIVDPDSTWQTSRIVEIQAIAVPPCEGTATKRVALPPYIHFEYDGGEPKALPQT